MRCLLACLALLAALPGATPAAAQPDFSRVDALLQDSLALVGGGAVLRVVTADAVLTERVYGRFAAAEAVPIASASKWISGAVVLSLVDSGLLSLESPLSQFFPDLTGAKRAITVRQLFSHTSGIVAPETGSCHTSGAGTLAACAAEILARPLRFAPGTGFFYGGGSMQVAGRVAEIASGQSWNALFAARIAGPLGMTGTGYSPTNPWVSGGLVSTAQDYTAFLQMVLGRGVYRGRRVLSAAAIDAMLADQTAGAPVLFSPFTQYVGGDPDLPPAQPRYGVGVWRERLSGSGALEHASSQGAFGTSPWVDLAHGRAGILLVQDDLPDVMWTYLELKRRLATALDGTTAAENGPGGAGARLGPPAPNPATGRVRLPVTLAAPADVRLDVFDVRGRRVAGVAPAQMGTSTIDVDVGALARGLYVAVLRVDGVVSGRQRIVVR